MGWTIKQISSITGIPADCLRYYDKIGILSPKREDNGYRSYEQKDLEKIKYIEVMKYAQFSLAEISQVLERFEEEPNDECNKASKELLSKKVEILIETSENYFRIAKSLQSILLKIESSHAFSIHKYEIDEFIKNIYECIKKQGKL